MLMKRWERLELRKKIVIVIIVVGLLPTCILAVFSRLQMERMSREKQEYIMNQNFDMMCSSVRDRTERMQEVAAYLTVEDSISSLFQDFTKKTVQKKIQLYSEIEKISRQYMETSSLSDIYFYLRGNLSQNGVDYKRNVGSRFFLLESIVSQDWYQKFVNTEMKSCFTILPIEEEDSVGLAFVRALWDQQNYQQLEGLVVTVMDEEQFAKELVSVDEEQVVFLECNGEIVASNNISQAKKIQSDMPDIGTFQGNLNDYYCIRQEIDQTGIWLVSILNREAFYAETKKTLWNTIILFFVMMCVIALLSSKVAGSLTRRISLLEEKWKEMQKNGELTKLEIPETQDEIGHLITTYNYLVDEIDILMEEQRRIGEEKKDAILKALQSQINPHFLYNTLEMISWMVVKEDKKKAQEMIRQLSRYYKLVLNKGQDIVTLSHEIALCQAYMEIQSKRFLGKIQFVLEADSEIMDFQLPKIILQPILENSILHGIIPKKGGHGTIWLKTRKEKDEIILEVIDDGVGFCYEKQEQEVCTTGSHYGLNNIQTRLEMYFEKEHCLEVESTLGIGTRVIMKLPCSRGEKA